MISTSTMVSLGKDIKKVYFCDLKTNEKVPVAQLVEQLTLNQWVQGSNP